MDSNKPTPRYLDRDKWGMNHVDAVGDQLARFGITAYVLMNINGEGQILPSDPDGSGVEDITMAFNASDGNGYYVSLRWNPDKTAPDGSRGYYELESSRFFVDSATGKNAVERIPWVEGQPIPIQDRDKVDPASTEPYYIQSRKLLGLPVSEKQEEILRDFLMVHTDDHQGMNIRVLKKTVTVLNQPPAKSDGN